MKLKISLAIIVALYIATVIIWCVFVVTSGYAGVLEGWQFTYLVKPFLIGMTVIPLAGGLLGLKSAFNWGGVKSIMGRSCLFLSLGLIAWGSGMIAWNYYIFFTTIEVPYPSLADAGFAIGLVFFVMGIWSLSKAVGVRFALRTRGGKMVLLLVPVFMVLVSVYLLVYIARGGVLIDTSGGYLKLFFDLLYPLGDVLILTITSSIYLLSMKFLGGKYKMPILMLFFGFLMFYISDFMFSYTTTQETYFNGHLVDFLFTTTMFILSISLTILNPAFLNSEKTR